MRYFILLFCFLLVQSCKTNDDIICYGDPIPSRIVFINLVDNDGNNLIENGTYNSDDIEVTFNGYTNPDPFFKNNPEFENLILVTVVGNEGDNTYEIQLSNSTTDILSLNLSGEFIGSEACGSIFFKPNTAHYNGIAQTLEDFDTWNYLVTITK
ncbi:hypothetical protein [uncultured Algibacter sp.]|uniref:hypothetical protein n=1 Tax=uncultured Algibacter sp. TaxID=298659 RepID=UPI002606C19B|nr:hypothetical protein [uncultured Algibacter sp.]